VTSELRAEPGEAWARDEDRDEAQAVHPGRHRRAPEARSSYREVFAIGNITYQASQILGFVAVPPSSPCSTRTRRWASTP